MKTYFQLKDNVLDKKLSIVVNSQAFANRKQVSNKVQEVVRFFAENFTKGKVEEAERQLENHNYEVRRKDAILISYFCGTITIMFLMFLVLLSIPDSALERQDYDAGVTSA